MEGGNKWPFDKPYKPFDSNQRVGNLKKNEEDNQLQQQQRRANRILQNKQQIKSRNSASKEKGMSEILPVNRIRFTRSSGKPKKQQSITSHGTNPLLKEFSLVQKNLIKLQKISTRNLNDASQSGKRAYYGHRGLQKNNRQLNHQPQRNEQFSASDVPSSTLIQLQKKQQIQQEIKGRIANLDRQLTIYQKSILEATEKDKNATRRFEQSEKRYNNAMDQLDSIERTESNEQKIMDKKQHVNRLEKVYNDSLRGKQEAQQRLKQLEKQNSDINQKLNEQLQELKKVRIEIFELQRHIQRR